MAHTPLLAALIGLVGCAPVDAIIEPIVDTPVDAPVSPDTVWMGVWLPTALDRLLLRGNRDEGCLQIGLVGPGSWPSDYPVDVADPWGLESVLWGPEPCPSDPYGAWSGRPVDFDGLEGDIAVTPEWPPMVVTLDLRVQIDGQSWTEDVAFELEP